MPKRKKCKLHKCQMIYFYGYICPICFPAMAGQAPVTEFDKALRAEMKKEQNDKTS